jgi:hypothetical protein
VVYEGNNATILAKEFAKKHSKLFKGYNWI